MKDKIGMKKVSEMTLKEYIAGLAMQGLLANEFYTRGKYNVAEHIIELLKIAVGMADKLLEELTKEN